MNKSSQNQKHIDFSLSALKLMQSCYTERKQRTKINQNLQFLGGNTFRCVQELVLRPILFNIFLCDLHLSVFLVVKNIDFASYPDDNTIYNTGDNIDNVIFSLQESSKQGSFISE